MKPAPLIRSSLRWPGNKFSLLPEILPLIESTSFKNYHEPFVGSASVFLNLSKVQNAYLSDANENLVNFYLQVQRNLGKLILKIKEKKNNERFFYKERATTYRGKIDKAAQFYYLNRTCYNGIYRVNSKGEFNVPYGRRTELVVADEDNLLMLRERLHNVEITAQDFIKAGKNIKSGDLVYFDPPYSAKTNSKNFLMYNETLFSWNDQVRLKNFCKQLIDKDVKIIINNLYNEEVYNLFAEGLGLRTVTTNRFSGIGSQMYSRGKINEYLFTNIDSEVKQLDSISIATLQPESIAV
jgi:DNA adenine methylase